MSRIRSIHPGFFTDEDLVSVSMAARLLFIGLGVEADDKGVFEWKPLTIKMRVFPADNVDVGIALDELAAVSAIRKYEIDGRHYGAIRNFRKFQRPKTPNDIHPISDDIRNFVGLTPTVSEIAVNEVEAFPPKGEKSPQMEDGGGREGCKKEKGYAFSAGVVRLSRQDYDQWRKQFHRIADFDAELATLAAWLSEQSADKKRKWFATGASWMNRRHQEFMQTDRKVEEVGYAYPIA